MTVYYVIKQELGQSPVYSYYCTDLNGAVFFSNHLQDAHLFSNEADADVARGHITEPGFYSITNFLINS